MPADYDKTRAEDCRYAVRHHLAVCSHVARDSGAIRRNINRRGDDFTEREVIAALTFLVDLGQVNQVNAELGSTRNYQITAAGTLADERSEN